MAVTVNLKTPSGEDDPKLALTLDAPRVVIGRSRACEVLLPDPTVSPRHASIRQRGGENLIVDEGSTNGILVGSVKLPAHTPRAAQDGELVRVGRMWLELRFGVGVPTASHQATAVAAHWLRLQMAADGECVHPILKVVEGPDAGTELQLRDDERDYVIGRSQQADLTLADHSLSRRHSSIGRRGTDWIVRDLGSKRGCSLGDAPLDADGCVWAPGEQLHLGASVLELLDPIPDALAELMAAPDERMSPREFTEPLPGRESSAAAEVVTAPVDPAAADATEPDHTEEDELALDDGEHEELAQPGIPFLETAVVIIALAMLGVSVAGLVWLLGG